MKNPHEYRLHLVDIGGGPHPDKRLTQFLRTLRDHGFALTEACGHVIGLCARDRLHPVGMDCR